jgi:cytochrome b6-f complex iron-sulfur subunit
MPLVDDLSAPTPTIELSRRKLLGTLTGAALSVSGLGTAVTTIRYLRPNVLFEPATRFKLGRPEDIPVGTLLVLGEKNLFVAHGTRGFFAMSSVCTHLGCVVRYTPGAAALHCPCHGSEFDREGAVTGGPAPRPLVRFALTVEGGELVVDTRREVAEDFVLEAGS